MKREFGKLGVVVLLVLGLFGACATEGNEAASEQADLAAVVQADMTWRLRSLGIKASYAFLIDDYRDLSDGDHQFFFSLVRKLEYRLGGAEE